MDRSSGSFQRDRFRVQVSGGEGAFQHDAGSHRVIQDARTFLVEDSDGMKECVRPRARWEEVKLGLTVNVRPHHLSDLDRGVIDLVLDRQVGDPKFF